MIGSFIPRKIFHLILASIPPGVYWTGSLNRWEMASGLLGLLVLSLSIEWARLRNEWINQVFIRGFGFLMKEKESTTPTSINHTLGSYLVVVALTEHDIAVASMFFLSLGDPVASLLGRQWGKPFFGSKSLLGTGANFLVCLALGFAILKSPLESVLGAAASSVAELYSGRIDDNLTVPVASAAVLSLYRIGFG